MHKIIKDKNTQEQMKIKIYQSFRLHKHEENKIYTYDYLYYKWGIISGKIQDFNSKRLKIINQNVSTEKQII